MLSVFMRQSFPFTIVQAERLVLWATIIAIWRAALAILNKQANKHTQVQ